MTDAPLTVRYLAGKCICSDGDHGHERWFCPGNATKVPWSPHSHRCWACWGAEHKGPAIRDVALIALYLAGMTLAAIWIDGVDGFWLWLFGATSALVGLSAWRALR